MLVPTEAGRLVSCLSLQKQESWCHGCPYRGREIDVTLVLTEAGRLVSCRGRKTDVMLVPTEAGRLVSCLSLQKQESWCRACPYRDRKVGVMLVPA